MQYEFSPSYIKYIIPYIPDRPRWVHAGFMLAVKKIRDRVEIIMPMKIILIFAM